MRAFILEDYINRNDAMACDTPQEIAAFCEFLDRAGRTWCTGEKYVGSNVLLGYDSRALYFNEGCHGHIESYEHDTTEEPGTLLKFSDYDDFIVSVEIGIPSEDEACFSEFISAFSLRR